uniref:Protein tweety homolog n=1 Tax=Alexandrium catenella TaxID=2925 RepID=A0A7S1RWT5_ALECA|mmetsp:Transcript_7570/g.20500  ORF Transcript_7570/g.20500 Transcript_7570/m.20500 type:complete len:463 (+) Transcript_7570:68-1456(+)
MAAMDLTASLPSLLVPSPSNPFKQPWTATWWVKLFEHMGPEFPAPDAPEETWHHFVVSCSLGPFVLLALGALVTMGVLCCTCLCRPRARRAVFNKPTWKCSAFIGLVTLVLIVLGTIIYWRTGSVTWERARSELDRALLDTTTARDKGEMLRSAGAWMLQDLDDIPEPCQEKAQGPLQTLKDELSLYLGEVDHYRSDLDSLPDRIRSVQDLSGTISLITRVGLLVPLLLVLICCMSVILALVCAKRGRCSLCCIQCLGPLLFTPTVLLIAAVAAVQLEVAVVSSSFCADVDSNALAYIKHEFGASSAVYEVSEYYITKSGRNPLLEELQNASATLQSVKSTVATYGAAIQQACPDWHSADNLTSSIVIAQESVDMGQSLLSLGNIYHYYEEVVRKDACETAVIGLGWLISFQAVVGLVFLPWLITLALRYLKARRIWHVEQQQGRERLVVGIRAEMRGTGVV